jgi:hypothetical protein
MISIPPNTTTFLSLIRRRAVRAEQLEIGHEPSIAVRNAVLDKIFRSGFEHYLAAGAKEGRQIALGLPAFH